MRNLLLLPEAKQDIRNAYFWYEKQAFSLGKDFLQSLEACFSLIQKNPKRIALVDKVVLD